MSMKVLKCEIEDLPGHIAAIERYNYFYKIDIVESGMQNRMIAYTHHMYHNPDAGMVPFKIIDETGNAIAYVALYNGKTIPVTLVKGIFLSDYGNKHYVALDLLNVNVMYVFINYVIEEIGAKEVLVYHRIARARFTNKFMKNLTASGLPLEGWEVSIIADIPPYGVVKDKLLSEYLVGRFNGTVPVRMGIIQLKKIA